MYRPPPSATLPDTLSPDTTLFRCGRRLRGRGDRSGGSLGLVAADQLAVLGLVSRQLCEDPLDVRRSVGVAPLVLRVGPGAELAQQAVGLALGLELDRKSTRLNSSH